MHEGCQAMVFPPLTVGDNIQFEKQVGLHLPKWNKTGQVIRVQHHDLNMITLDGSGSVTI